MKTKKLLALLMAGAMSVSVLSGCGGSAAKTDDSSADAADTSASAESDVDYVKSNGKLVIGITDFAPMDYKEETGRPVYAYCEDYCASGGYYIASAADEIVANRNSFVGSIGVICGQFVDATELLEKLGIDITTVHSGANKLMGSSYESPTEEQIAIYQELSDEIYDRFVGIVADSRDMSDADVSALADGRIYSAQQGVDNGLVDDIMTQEEFDDHLRELLGDDISFYHQTYEQETTSLIWEFLNNAVSAIRANGDEVTANLQAIDEMTYDEPMLIYEP